MAWRTSALLSALPTLGRALALAWQADRRAICLQTVLSLAAGAVPVAAAWLTKAVLDQLAAGAPPGDFVAPVAGLAATGVLMATIPDVARFLGSNVDRCG